MADAKPTGPPPAAGSAPPPSDWPPLRLEELPPVEPFPVDVLPEPAARLVREGADAIGCPRDFLGVPMLAVAAGDHRPIGQPDAQARLLRRHRSSFAGNVGPPSDGKTPALKAVADAVRAISDQLAAEHAQAIERWKQEAAEAAQGNQAAAPAQAPADRHRRCDDGSLAPHPGGQPAGTDHDPG